jgi:hypothetical protein
MPPTNVVVDGSNIATEGRSTPSLEQLDQAVRQYLSENPDSRVTVVVDASFGHRIDPSERPAFEEAVAHGEIVSPPAGAIGRGDAFLLRVAERTGARVLSNDSFREFHVEHPWLFDDDRLVGGTPVPGVGWIFSPRRPVRGPLTPDSRGRSRDRKAPAEGKREAKSVAKAANKTAEKKPARRTKKREEPSEVQAAIAQATEEALGDEASTPPARALRRKKSSAPEAVNDPLPFIRFVSDHPLGSRFEGTVVSFTSHGAMAMVGDMLCYVPLAGLSDPPPTRARDVLKQGETRTFELVALDPVRRGAQLALPEIVATTGQIAEGDEEAASEVRRRRRKTEEETKAKPATEPVRTVKVAKAGKVTKPAKVSKAVKAPGKAQKATKATKAAKVTKAAKAPGSAKAAKVAKATKAAKVTKAVRAASPAKVAKQARPAKSAQQAKKAAAPSKATKATKAAKATTTTKAAKATKAARATKQSGDVKRAVSRSSTPRKVVKSS